MEPAKDRLIGLFSANGRQAPDGRTWPEMRNADLETFNALDPDTRRLILRMLGDGAGPSEEDHQALERHPRGAALSSWLLELPAYLNTADDDEEDPAS